jgi:glycerophosphoryl diester phosphodiesterase
MSFSTEMSSVDIGSRKKLQESDNTSSQGPKNSYESLIESRRENETQPIIICGHRGGFLPENTLLAFKQAKENQI